MDYMTIKEASEKWSVGTRIINVYCSAGRVKGAIKRGNLWLIPQNAKKPDDLRYKKVSKQEKAKPLQFERENEKPIQFEAENCESKWPFKSLYENKELFIEIIKNFPYPMHICAPDGTMLLANEEYLRFAKISNPERIYKKHNILLNPNLERWGVKDFVERAFQGEAVCIYDIKVPYQEIIERLGDYSGPICESMFHNITALPIRDSNNQLLYVAFIFITSRSYQGKEEIIKGKEYIDNHWKEDFDADKLSDIVHISRYHYTRMFRQHTGLTPYQYYINIKIEKLKEKLCDRNLTISQAFTECGLNYNGNFVKTFKQKVGMSPSQYRSFIAQA